MADALLSKDVEVHASAVMVVLDTYPRMIIEIIGNQWSAKQVFKLTQNEKDQSFMRNITPLQRQMISKLDVSGYINLDVSCIYKLIRHFNLLPVPKQGWGKKPSIHDTKEGDDVERMKIYRNDILHRPRGGLSEQEGTLFFQASYEMAKRLDISIGSPMNGFESKIKAIQCFSVDRQKYVEALEKCADYQAQLQETRDSPIVDLYYGNDIMMKLGSSDNQNASGDSHCSLFIRDQNLDVEAVIRKLDNIRKTLKEGPYNVINLNGGEIGSLILHISIPNTCFVTEDTLQDSLRSFLHHFFLTAGIHCKWGHSFTIVLAESERYITDNDEQDLEYLSETPLPILKLDVNVQNSAFQNENVLYKEIHRFVTGMYDAIDSNGVPVNGSQKEVMMLTGSENEPKRQLKETDYDEFVRHNEAVKMKYKRYDNKQKKWKTDLQTIIDKEVRIFLIGKKGSGKSETGNTLLGKQIFESDISSDLVTTKFCFGTTVIDGRNIVIVDGPGLFFDSGLTEVNMKKELAKATALLAPGPNVFILIVELNRFDESVVRAIDMYKQAFGKELMKYLIVVFTRGDILERNCLTIEDYVRKFEDGQTRTFLASCENRYLSINNIAAADIKEKEAMYIFDVVFHLEKRNERKIYQNAEFIRAEKEINNRIQEMVNKSSKPLTYDDILTLRASVRSEIVGEASWFNTIFGTLIVGFGAAIALYFGGSVAVVAGIALITSLLKN